ncbi:hypothetical protein Tco_0265385 [Tanacetum coccineum]
MQHVIVLAIKAKQPGNIVTAAVKRIFRYLKDSINMGLWYPKETGFELTAFSDSDHAGCLDSRKSTSGGIQFLGGDKLVSWSSKKQDCTSISSAEAESYALSWKPCQGDSLNLPDHRSRRRVAQPSISRRSDSHINHMAHTHAFQSQYRSQSRIVDSKTSPPSKALKSKKIRLLGKIVRPYNHIVKPRM